MRDDIIALADELSHGVEDRSVRTSTLVGKAHRLAMMVENERYTEFFFHEMTGYGPPNANTKQFLLHTNRMQDNEAEFTAGALSVLEDNVDLWVLEAEAQKAFIPTGDWAAAHHQGRMNEITRLHGRIILNERIIETVRALCYFFATAQINLRVLSVESADIFRSYQKVVDQLLSQTASSAFEKLPAIFERLQAGSSEAKSHALTSSRRIIDAFADSVFPATDEPVQLGGETLDCKQNKHQNRIYAYIHPRTASVSRRKKLRRTLADLYDRVSSGVHADVAEEEAQALVLQTYLFLGEVVALKPE